MSPVGRSSKRFAVWACYIRICLRGQRNVAQCTRLEYRVNKEALPDTALRAHRLSEEQWQPRKWRARYNLRISSYWRRFRIIVLEGLGDGGMSGYTKKSSAQSQRPYGAHPYDNSKIFEAWVLAIFRCFKELGSSKNLWDSRYLQQSKSPVGMLWCPSSTFVYEIHLGCAMLRKWFVSICQHALGTRKQVRRSHQLGRYGWRQSRARKCRFWWWRLCRNRWWRGGERAWNRRGAVVTRRKEHTQTSEKQILTAGTMLLSNFW